MWGWKNYDIRRVMMSIKDRISAEQWKVLFNAPGERDSIPVQGPGRHPS